MSNEQILERIDDIVYGLWTGTKFGNDRFEQKHREIIAPEPLDANEQKAEIVRLLNDLGIKI